MSNSDVNIFDYLDYAKFIRDIVDYKREHGRFSFRLFCKRSGFKSPSYLKWVMDGARKISLKSIHKFAKGLGLDSKEQNYFQLLVQYQDASDANMKNNYFQKLLKLKKRNCKYSVLNEEYEYLSHWSYVAIRELASYIDFKDDPHWVQEQLKGNLGIVEIKQALRTLKRLKLIQKKQVGGYAASEGEWHSGAQVASHAAFRYHDDVLELSRDILSDVPEDQREFQSIASLLDKEAYEEMKKIVHKLQQEMVQYLTREDVIARLAQNGDQELYLLNTQLFPISNLQKK